MSEAETGLNRLLQCWHQLGSDERRVLLHVAGRIFYVEPPRDLDQLLVCWGIRDTPRLRLELVTAAERYLTGMRAPTYGPLNLAADTRDFVRESLEEKLDMYFYDACEVLRARDRGPR